ncbi:acyl-CoA dehydrogenase C-terminal domain-containing protein [Parendozoicomonas haliclonae]|uniref:3-methylmercaptopropionyl-CoA dehydrogenase n=1 Tax=Parendozoicomonas haliclonae TaxID=1960125 RepID=A0A1X7AHX7_9GAMM|nr:acyl-CoA dehydrogenase C-terminal domain-containing protein [Parendozoicomonas haliclonae]SMA43798.1 Acyl-CoA dehydrogenase [Parendozoicomonas haliclonae]
MSAHYQAPLRDIRFLINELLQGGRTDEIEKFSEVTPDLIDAILEEGARICENEFLAANAPGDEQGCTYHPDTRSVTTPNEYKQAYKAFAEGGWLSMALDEAYGGQAMPHLLGFVMEEMSCSANMSLSMYPGLTIGAMNLISAHASEELKHKYLPRMATGEWTGTMCLTEPQCGTDLGLIKSKAVPNDDGSFALTGNKIWITSGEHDLADNIIHLVLAKLPDAPSGVKGISLFLVPKFLGEEAKDENRNPIWCTGLEHKMGIKGSATCFISLEEATGWLVGEPHRGLHAMFTMMNDARLMVGLQGLGASVSAYQTALAFAKERQQSRSVTGPKQPNQPADTITVHPDVRRMLLRQKTMIEANRALAYWTGMHIDVARHHKDPDQRQAADDFVQLLTPIVKAHLTDEGSTCCNLAIQTLGGSGYTKDWGIEQLARDVRITRIYEGTNGIQALDLVGRKLPSNGGRAMRSLLSLINDDIAKLEQQPHSEQVRHALQDLQTATLWLSKEGLKDPEQAAQAASPFLRLMGLTLGGWLWLKMAALAKEALDKGSSEAAFYNAKIKSAAFFLSKVLPETRLLLKEIEAGKEPLMAFLDEEF